MIVGKEMMLVSNPTLVFDGNSFILKEKGVKYIHPSIRHSINELSVEYNMVVVFPAKNKFKASLRKFINRGKEERIFPAVHVYANADEVQVLLKKHGSPLISLNDVSNEYSSIPPEYRVPFLPNMREFKRLLLTFELSLIPIEAHFRPPVDLHRAFLRKERRTRFEEKFK